MKVRWSSQPHNNPTNYSMRRLAAIFRATHAIFVRDEKPSPFNTYWLRVGYCGRGDGHFGWSLTGSLATLYLDHHVQSVRGVADTAYRLFYWVTFGQQQVDVPSDHFESICRRFGDNLIEYPKIPKPPPTRAQKRESELKRLKRQLPRWMTKRKYADTRIRTIQRRITRLRKLLDA